MRRTMSAIAALLILAAVVAGCTHSTGGGAGAEGGGGGTNGGAVAGASGAPSSAAGLAPVTHAPAGSTRGIDVATVANLGERQEIRTATITVAVKGAHHGADHIAQQADAATAIADRVGGEVTADDRVNGRHATATLVLRVPPNQVEATLRALSRLGTEKSRQLSTVDVTSRVADVASRVTSARAAIARLRTLYRQATKVRDLIAVESELSSREADLESLEGRQRALGNHVARATITLRLMPAAKPKRGA